MWVVQVAHVLTQTPDKSGGAEYDFDFFFFLIYASVHRVCLQCIAIATIRPAPGVGGNVRNFCRAGNRGTA